MWQMQTYCLLTLSAETDSLDMQHACGSAAHVGQHFTSTGCEAVPAKLYVCNAAWLLVLSQVS